MAALKPLQQRSTLHDDDSRTCRSGYIQHIPGGDNEARWSKLQAAGRNPRMHISLDKHRAIRSPTRTAAMRRNATSTTQQADLPAEAATPFTVVPLLLRQSQGIVSLVTFSGVRQCISPPVSITKLFYKGTETSLNSQRDVERKANHKLHTATNLDSPYLYSHVRTTCLLGLSASQFS